MSRSSFSSILVLLSACGSVNAPGEGDADSDADVDADGDTDSDTSSDAGPLADASPDGGGLDGAPDSGGEDAAPLDSGPCEGAELNECGGCGPLGELGGVCGPAENPDGLLCSRGWTECDPHLPGFTRCWCPNAGCAFCG